MSFSPPNTYSTILSDDQLAALNTSTITLTGTGGSTVTFNNNCFTSFTSGTTSTYCIPNIQINSIDVWGHSEWVDSFPSWARIQKMCDEYPSLKIAFEKFKNTYNLVKDDYDAPPDKKIRP